MSEMLELMEKLKRESKQGGELTELPCPLCGLPRSQRSDYIRCSPCGMNWLVGEDLTKSPLLSRMPYIGHLKQVNGNTAQTAEPTSDL